MCQRPVFRLCVGVSPCATQNKGREHDKSLLPVHATRIKHGPMHHARRTCPGVGRARCKRNLEGIAQCHTNISPSSAPRPAPACVTRLRVWAKHDGGGRERKQKALRNCSPHSNKITDQEEAVHAKRLDERGKHARYKRHPQRHVSTWVWVQ